MILSSLIFLPLFFALVLCAWPQKNTIRHVALGFSLIEFVLSLVMLKSFNPSTAVLQMVEKTPWIERFGISYFLGIDGISLMLVMLTTFLIPIIVLAAWNSIEEKRKGFFITDNLHIEIRFRGRGRRRSRAHTQFREPHFLPILK